MGPPFPVVRDQLVCLADIEGEVVLAPHFQVSDLLPIGCLIIGDQALIIVIIVVGKLNDGVGVGLIYTPAETRSRLDGIKSDMF